MTSPTHLSLDAADQYGPGTGHAFEDVQQRRLRYHLLRLTVVGLAHDEIEDLCDLGRLAFANEPLTPAFTAISQRANLSPLARAITDILQTACGGVGGPVQLGSVMLGAVLGAYAGVRELPGIDRQDVAIVGAVGGAISASAGSAGLQALAQVGVAEYTRATD